MPMFSQDELNGMVAARYHDRMRAQIAQLITPELVQEHKQVTFGQHSGALQRVLNYVGNLPMQGKLILEHDGHQQWYVSRLHVQPTFTRTERISGPYSSEAVATHAVFVRRIHEIINIDVDGEEDKHAL